MLVVNWLWRWFYKFRWGMCRFFLINPKSCCDGDECLENEAGDIIICVCGCCILLA